MDQTGGLAMMVLGLGGVIDPPLCYGVESVKSKKVTRWVSVTA